MVHWQRISMLINFRKTIISFCRKKSFGCIYNFPLSKIEKIEEIVTVNFNEISDATQNIHKHILPYLLYQFWYGMAIFEL